MDMGTGKTRTALELVWLRRKRITKCVWCCPVSLMEETKREILRHTSCIDTDIHMIGPRTREKNVPQTWWHIVGLESLSSSPRVVDESTYIKGHRAKRTRRLIRFGTRTSYRLILTGTPIQQGIEDLYTQMEFLSPLILGYTSRHAFQSALAVFQTQKRAFSVESMSLGEVCRILCISGQQGRLPETASEDVPPHSVPFFRRANDALSGGEGAFPRRSGQLRTIRSQHGDFPFIQRVALRFLRRSAVRLSGGKASEKPEDGCPVR